ncbi:stressosome-associated protein Prli42 [Paenibacillus aurantius]|uniref:Stressosome-associated protein Prli42 n=1 Tax=Paenibacillus aurantius TaxID=2918900 RepID=A0AA96RBC3_9BACL|nr:stressosome-associated protein Prli42 [Paenibacillus aurantius]WJH34269.1 stressosome-associated protein Prli42 [Paenibacillus sp. CC-CFT747]WNQ09370.1 stressosome-associated protein Prli42 [Paenibacillus aurantius]
MITRKWWFRAFVYVMLASMVLSTLLFSFAFLFQ